MVTDRPGEQLFVHHLEALPVVQLWTVRNSDRLWAMHHETYTACLVLAPDGCAPPGVTADASVSYLLGIFN